MGACLPKSHSVELVQHSDENLRFSLSHQPTAEVQSDPAKKNPTKPLLRVVTFCKNIIKCSNFVFSEDFKV